MDIENMSKTDLIVTAFFLCFVTAIVTGIVMVFLFEDTPEDIIRVSERIVPEESTSTNKQAATVNNSEGTNRSPASSAASRDNNQNQSRDTILNASVEAVARVTADNTPPQAGVLLSTDNGQIVVTSKADFDTNIQALFKNGVVMNLAATNNADPTFSRLAVQEASGQVAALSITSGAPSAGESLFVVPLSGQPEIVRVSVTSVSGDTINTSAGSLPPVSLLIDGAGDVVGLYNVNTGSFKVANTITP